MLNSSEVSFHDKAVKPIFEDQLEKKFSSKLKVS